MRSKSKNEKTSTGLEGQVIDFLSQTDGLFRIESEEHDILMIKQKIDGRVVKLKTLDLSEVLERKDSDGRDFIQINFESGMKVLLTNSLVGFKPIPTVGLDLERLPRVVTTPDLMSVEDAISEALSSEFTHVQEVEVLKKVFESVIKGAELIGFDLHEEREWLDRIHTSRLQASA